MGRRLSDGSAGVKTTITIAALAATVIGWAVLAAARPPEPAASPPPAARVVPSGAVGEPPADGLPPLPGLVSVDTRPLPPPPVPRVDVRTSASRRVR